FDVLGKGVTWDWETFPQYLDAAQRRGCGINLGFMAALTPFRHYVMGEESMERPANADETAKIAALIKEAVAAGAFGFTTTAVPQHIGYKGRPIACRNASPEEFKAYCGSLRELGRGAIELALTKSVSVISDEEYAFLDMLLTESTRPVTWLALLNRDDMPEACQETLRRAEPLIRRGGVPQVTCRPLMIQINLRDPFIFANLDCWNPVFNQPREAQKKFYRDATFRNNFREALKWPAVFNGKWDRLEIKEAGTPAIQALIGRTVAEVAQQRGCDGVDAFLDLGLEDDLGVEFTMELFNANEDRIPELITDKRTMVGLSDGGAHVDMLCDAGYCTYLLGTWARDRQVMPLEHAIKRITSEPADFFGIRNRGRLLPGMAADVVAFDFKTVGSGKRGEMRNDLPGGGRRLVMPARGIEHVFVNGHALYEHGKASEGLHGQVLRSGNC
ncbi:MAG TPA: amidohydrolase family protein, partial [Candidatus Binataceae bacterium]|nr:amidohydrolase family protein [Candidatus Binataceae bacterium]